MIFAINDQNTIEVVGGSSFYGYSLYFDIYQEDRIIAYKRIVNPTTRDPVAMRV